MSLFFRLDKQVWFKSYAFFLIIITQDSIIAWLSALDST